VRKAEVVQGMNQQSKPAMSDGFHEEVPTVSIGKKGKASVRQGQGNILISGIKEHRQDKEQEHAYEGDGTARTTLGLISVSSCESEVALEILDSESTTEDDVVEVIDLVAAETASHGKLRGGRSPNGASDYMGKPKKGHERTSQKSGIQGGQVGRTIGEEEQHHVWAQFLKDVTTAKGGRKKASTHAASDRQEQRTDKSIREEIEPVNSFNSHDLSVHLEEFYKSQRALLASYNLNKREGPSAYHKLAGQGQITPGASDYLASTRESFETNHVSFVFVVHKKKGLLLKRIKDGSLLRYEVPGGMVSERDYATAGKVSVLPWIMV
jgi:hypothetical protein